MTKFDAYSRRELRRLRRSWLKRNRLVLGVALGLLLAVTGAVSFTFTHVPPTRWSGYLLGAFHAGAVSAVLFALNSAFLAHHREAIWHVRGAWGEENTRDELKRAKRKRLVWDWVDSINLQAGDLDHVVVTRRGGLVVIDSKWRSTVDASTVQEMTASARRAKSRGEALARSLLSTERGAKRRAKVQPLAVTPVVVVWGAAQAEVPDGTVREGVHFVRGRHLTRWLGTLDHDAVDRAAARDLVGRLKAYRVATWVKG